MTIAQILDQPTPPARNGWSTTATDDDILPAMKHGPPPGTRLIRAGIGLLAVPAVLLLAVWQHTGSLGEAGQIASWPTFLMWPTGTLLITAGLVGRLLRSKQG